MKRQLIPEGYYNSNTKDCDVFCVKGTIQDQQKFYFRQDNNCVKCSAGADVKWSITNKQTFDHCISVTDTVTVEAGAGGGYQYSDKNGKGFYVSANYNYGASVEAKTQWAYHDDSGDSISAWGAVSAGVGGNVGGSVGVWYDKDGDLHVKFGLDGVIPECPGFGLNATLSKSTVNEVGDDTTYAEHVAGALTGNTDDVIAVINSPTTKTIVDTVSHVVTHLPDEAKKDVEKIFGGL